LQFELVQQLAAALGRRAELFVPQGGAPQFEMHHRRLGAGRAGLGLVTRQLLGHQCREQRSDVVSGEDRMQVAR